MRHRVAAVAVLVGAAAVISANGAAREQAGAEPVQISAVVVDRHGIPVRGLQPTDFVLRENGQDVPLLGVDAGPGNGSTARGRSIVLVLGNGASVNPSRTKYVQRIANSFMARAETDDSVSVVRFGSSAHDEVAGSRSDVLMRIAEYRAPMGQPLHAKSAQDVLETVKKISNDLVSDAGRRRAIVFIGAAPVFDVLEPPQRERELDWPYWVDALKAAARANVSVYVIDPDGLTGRVVINPDGLVVQTGGLALDNSNEFENAINRVWQETHSYYALSYQPSSSKRELQTIRVNVSRKDVDVRVRRSR